MRITDKYVFFYKDWLSNYQRTRFKINIDRLLNKEYHIMCEEFTSTEQAFMFIKALYFNDLNTAKKIKITDHPGDCRKLGRQVQNYNDSKWSKVRYNIFYELNLSKYCQDKNLQKKLLDSQFDNKIFVEASPIDRIWGVGLDENNPLIDDKENWRGTNFLGKILTEIRQKIKEGYIQEDDTNIEYIKKEFEKLKKNEL